MALKASDILPDDLLPPELKDFLSLFDAINNIYNFLHKRHLKCTQLNVANLLKSFGNAINVRLSSRDFILISQIDSNNIALIVSESDSEDSRQLELSFIQHNGGGKMNHSKRRQCFRLSISEYIFQQCKGVINSFSKKQWTQILVNSNSTELNSFQIKLPALTPANLSILSRFEASSSTISPSDFQTIIPSNIGFSVTSQNKMEMTTGKVNQVHQNNPIHQVLSASANSIVQRLTHSPEYSGQIMHIEVIPRREAVYGKLNHPLQPSSLQDLLHSKLGIQQLYCHQAKGMNAIRSGQHVVISTSTSSGKSIVYNLPIVEAMLADDRNRALYLFPTKALAQDQLRALRQLVDSLPSPSSTSLRGAVSNSIIVEVCDGDSNFAERDYIRNRANIILTNPDMLHYTLLPQHKTWRSLFVQLKYVVIDEAHEYKGAFGAHVSCVIKRLIRICGYYNALPQFILCSATIANPRQHFLNLIPISVTPDVMTFAAKKEIHIGVDRAIAHASNFESNPWNSLCVIESTEDGSPCGERTFLVWNPPFKNPQDTTQFQCGDSLSSSKHDVKNCDCLFEEFLSDAVASECRNVLQIVRRTADNNNDFTMKEVTTDDTPNIISSAAAPEGFFCESSADTSNTCDASHSTCNQFQSALSFSYGYDYGQIQTNVNHPFPSFLRGCEDKSITFGTPVISNANVQYNGGWKRITSNFSKYSVLSNNQVEKGNINDDNKVSPAESNNDDVCNSVEGKKLCSLRERKSSIVETAAIFTLLIRNHIRTIAFCRTRKLVELVLKYTNENLDKMDDKKIGSYLKERVASYRGGYTKEERRIIESKLFSGNLLGVTATCALELGIDVGSLDVTVHMGYPGSMSSLWQQAGRAGRSGRDSTSILVCFDSPVDQYFVKNPAVLFSKSESVIAADNLHILRSHLLIASRELPLNTTFNISLQGFSQRSPHLHDVSPTDQIYVTNEGTLCDDIDPIAFAQSVWENAKLNNINYHEAELTSRSSTVVTHNTIQITDAKLWGEKYEDMIKYLVCSESIVALPSRNQTRIDNIFSFIGYVAKPTAKSNEKSFSLRMIDPITISIVDDKKNGEVIDSLGYSRAFYELFEGAVYMHRAQQYFIRKLDLVNHKAHGIPTRVDYHTSSLNKTVITISNMSESDGIICWGQAVVTAEVYGFQKVRLRTGEVFEKGVCSLPQLSYDTQAFWFDLPLHIKRSIDENGMNTAGAIHGVNHILLVLAQVYCQCDSADLETEHLPQTSALSQPFRVLIYDKRPGGLGLCRMLYDCRHKLLQGVHDMLRDCDCESGCPTCVLSSRCTSYNMAIDKDSALKLASALLKMWNAKHSIDSTAKSGMQADIHTPTKMAKKKLSMQRRDLMDSGVQ